ncbi:Hypothetical protein, putative [Bodo saltans]|uniref:Uncharacterized protein n=1 Tax=Bodo saltans TaxID=75058 RepID=A0A0S4JLW8_BODSA|nr:Hypothetical protein, putative [Bodo saltans]|eukprot:CUG92511.1 Hypothetical protein, putative [Bodo saltans]
MAFSSTYDASARVADLFAEWDDNSACSNASPSSSTTPSVVLCEVFGIGVLQQLLREVLGAASFRKLTSRIEEGEGRRTHRTVVFVNAVQLSSGNLDNVLRSAAYAAPPSDICSASVTGAGGARRVVYHGSLNSYRSPQLLWDSSLTSEEMPQQFDDVDDENVLQSRIRKVFEQHPHLQRSPVLVTVSVGLVETTAVGEQHGASGDNVQWFDIHIADGIGGSGLLPEVVARCCSAVVAESHTVSTYDVVDNAAMRFWIPFLNLLHPRHTDAAVLVSVASSSHLIELHYFHDVMKKYFDASNDDMYVAVTRSIPREGELTIPVQFTAGAKKLVAESLLIDHALLCGEATPLAVFTRLNSALNGTLHPATFIGASSPPPKDPKSQFPLVSGGGGHLESVEMLIEEVEKVPLSQALLSPGMRRNSPDNVGETMLPNSSTYVSIADGSSMMSPPGGGAPPQQPPASRSGRVVVASVFDRLLAATPSPKSVARRKSSNSPNPGKRPPFVPGGGKVIAAAAAAHNPSIEVQAEIEPKPRISQQRNGSTDTAAAENRTPSTADAPFASSITTLPQRSAEDEEKHNLLQARFESLQSKFDSTVKELTKESETKLISKERELARLSERVKALQGQLDNAIEDNLQSTRTPATASTALLSEEDIRQLQSSLQDAEVTIRRIEEDKTRLEQMLEFSKRETESKTAAIEQQLKRQQQRLELNATKKLADDAAQQESRFALARSALEKQVEALANENQMLKDDKKNLVASMRMLRQASSGSGSPSVNGDGEFSPASSAIVDKKLSEMKGQLMNVRLELSQIHSERDALYQKDEAKSEQIATLQATIDMLKSQLAAERKTGGGGSGGDHHHILTSSHQHHSTAGGGGAWNMSSPSSSQQELQSFPGMAPVSTATSSGGVRRPTGPVAVSRISTSAVQQPQRRASGSPIRPGVAHYLLQQRLDPTEMVSPRKASQR